MAAIFLFAPEVMAKVTIYPGESEMMALAEGGHRVLIGEEEALYY